MDDYAKIGKITGVHGLKGKVVWLHLLPDARDLKKVDHIFIELKRESYIPFFPKDRQVLNENEVVLQLDDIDNPEAAKLLVGKDVYIEKELFAELAPLKVTEDFIGFTVKDKQLGVLGKIISLVESPGQVVAAVDYKGNEVLLPLVDQTIIKIDAVTRMIIMNLPEGLLEVYTDPNKSE